MPRRQSRCNVRYGIDYWTARLRGHDRVARVSTAQPELQYGANGYRHDEAWHVPRRHRASYGRLARSRRSSARQADATNTNVDIARLAERGKFDLLFMADTNATFGPDDVQTWTRTTQASRLEPITLLSALAAVTERIGLLPPRPPPISSRIRGPLFASLDHISGGRAGWNLVTSPRHEAFNFGREGHPHHGDRYDRALEFAEVVLGLWDSWEDGAVIADQASGLYFDPDKAAPLNHKGQHFSVRGPLNVARSPQGRPVIVQAGQSDAAATLPPNRRARVHRAARFRSRREFYADMNAASRPGRPPNTIKVMPGFMTVIGHTGAEAAEKFGFLQALMSSRVGEQGSASHPDLHRVSARGTGTGGPCPTPTGRLSRQRLLLEAGTARKTDACGSCAC